MAFCKTCGGVMILINGNQYLCPYCGNEYKTDFSMVSPVDRAVKIDLKDHGVDVFDTNINGVAEITWSTDTSTVSGSGFLISNRGYILTNTHVVTTEDGESCKNVQVKLCGKTVNGFVVKLGDDCHGHGNGVDLALVRLSEVPAQAKVLTFENFQKVRNGERVFVIGNSLGYGTCITSGIVSDRCRDVDGEMLLMTDCAVNGGNSGGPIFNERGRVIGVIVSGITGAEGMNFAIPSDIAIQFVQQDNHIFEKKQSVYDRIRDRYPKYESCPRCHGTSIDCINGIYYCYDCDYEF